MGTGCHARGMKRRSGCRAASRIGDDAWMPRGWRGQAGRTMSSSQISIWDGGTAGLWERGAFGIKQPRPVRPRTHRAAGSAGCIAGSGPSDKPRQRHAVSAPRGWSPRTPPAPPPPPTRSPGDERNKQRRDRTRLEAAQLLDELINTELNARHAAAHLVGVSV